MPRYCTEVSAVCPVELSIYGYQPSLAANFIFMVLFALAAVVQLIQGCCYRTWTFMTALVLGCICETAGYGGRLMLHNNVYDIGGFDIQIALLTVAPAFLSAGIYLMLKHIVIALGTSFSRLPPRHYTHIFITCDVISLILQAAGGGIAATADVSETTVRDLGNNLMLAGLCFQVFTLLVFGTLATDYALQARKNQGALNPETAGLRRSLRFRAFVAALAVAFFAILLRCIYRIAEMAKGWGNDIMQNEASFIARDSSLCAIAVVVLTLLHPGMCFNYRVVNANADKKPSQTNGFSYPSENDLELLTATPKYLV